jgi:predicted glycosyltransferase
MAADVMIHVQHLLGIGHLQRAGRIAAGCAAAGLDTVLASGGPPVPGLDFGGARLHQLPAARAADASFSHLLDAEGRPVDDAWKTRRAEAARALFERERPRVLLLELFPFGRRSLRFELLPLLQAAHACTPRPWVVVSLRDLLNPPAPEKAAWAIEVVERYVDRVLVHGDPALARLEETFPQAHRIADRLVYTGYVVPAMPQGVAPSGEVLVSTGGGAVGGALGRAAVRARALSRRTGEAPWRVLLGGNLPEVEFEAIRSAADAGTVVERNRADFDRLLAACRVSVSQAGYNTVTEVLAAGVPGVVVPFAGDGGEREQTLRADRLAARGRLQALAEAELTPARLAAAVDRADQPAPAPASRPADGGAPVDLCGIKNAAEILRALAAIVPAVGAGTCPAGSTEER